MPSFEGPKERFVSWRSHSVHSHVLRESEGQWEWRESNFEQWHLDKVTAWSDHDWLHMLCKNGILLLNSVTMAPIAFRPGSFAIQDMTAENSTALPFKSSFTASTFMQDIVVDRMDSPTDKAFFWSLKGGHDAQFESWVTRLVIVPNMAFSQSFNGVTSVQWVTFRFQSP